MIKPLSDDSNKFQTTGSNNSKQIYNPIFPNVQKLREDSDEKPYDYIYIYFKTYFIRIINTHMDIQCIDNPQV